MIGVEELAAAVRNARAITQEHEIDLAEYLHLSPEADESIRRMLSVHIDHAGLPTSRKLHRQQLLRFIKLGIVVGMELARAKIEEVP